MNSRGAIMLEDLAVTREAWLRRHNKPVKHKVSPHERESLHKWFSILDDDGSGSIDKKELDTGMRRLTSLPKEDVQDLKRMMKRFDTGSLDFESFVAGMSRADPTEVMKDAAEQEAEKRQTALLMMTYNRKRLVELFCDKEKRRLLDLEEPVSSLPDSSYDMSLAESQADPLRPGLNSMARFVQRRAAPCITQAQRKHRLQVARQSSLTSRPQASFCFRHYHGLKQSMESMKPRPKAEQGSGEPESLVSAVDTSSGRVFIKNYKQKVCSNHCHIFATVLDLTKVSAYVFFPPLGR
jgi:hypothetical protein